MKFKLLFIVLLGFGYLGAQDLNKVVLDEKRNQEVVVGNCNRSGLLFPGFKMYYENGYADYKPDDEIIKQIKKLKKDVEVIIVLGTWCHDTKTQLPHFFKIADLAGFNEKNLKLTGVDSNKKAGDLDIEWLEIVRVPTFIFYKNGREIGRIVEQPTTTLEKDILMILTLGL